MSTGEAAGEKPVEWDAIVVGSGFGGAVAACRLSQARFKVLIVERGRRYEADDFPALPQGSQLLPDLRRWTWQSEQGLWDILDLHEIISVQAAGYGGGSLIYANVHLRPPASVFDERWPKLYRRGEELEDYYDLVAAMLDAKPITEHDELGGRLIKADQLRRATRKLGRKNAFFNPPLAVNSDGLNRYGRHQQRCIGCGSCCSGCPERAKNTLDFNYLAVAEDNGVRVRTQCEVVDIVQCGDPDRPWWQVRCVDHLQAKARYFSAPNLFLCAGSIHSTRLLSRAKLRHDPHGIKERVGVGYFPGGDALGIVYDTKHPQYPSVGPTITTSTVHWNSQKKGSFFMIQDGGYAEELERMIGLLRAPLWLGRNRLTRSEPDAAARIKKSNGLKAPLESRLRPEQSRPSEDAIMPSPLDAVLDAVAGGSANAIVPAQLRQNLPAFLNEVTDAVLLPEVVDKTIDGALRAWQKRCFFTRWWPEWSLRLHRRIFRCFVRCFLASDLDLARRALRAMLTAAELPRHEVASRLLGHSASGAKNRTMLLAMGRDAASGSLRYDPVTDRLVADLDLFELGPGYARQEQLMMDLAKQLGGELRTSPAWTFLGKPVTVHNQGGCPMSDFEGQGVTNPNGQVHGCRGLYILDGSVLCTSVGVNPAPTIAAIAERNVLKFIEQHASEDQKAVFRKNYAVDVEAREAWKKRAADARWALRPPETTERFPFQSPKLGLNFRESMQGYCSSLDAKGLPTRDHEYQEFETRGRPENFVQVKLLVGVKDLATFFEDPKHRLRICGWIKARLPGEQTVHEGRLQGHLDLLVRKYKEYGISRHQKRRLATQKRLARHYRMRVDDNGAPPERLMRYRLRLLDQPGWLIRGYKRMLDDAGLDAWRDTTALFVDVLGPGPGGAGSARVPRGAGVIHVDLTGFLFEQIASIEITGTDDPARIVWATANFASFFFGSLQRIYVPQLGKALDTLYRPRHQLVQNWPTRRA